MKQIMVSLLAYTTADLPVLMALYLWERLGSPEDALAKLKAWWKE
jgi:hypothetical protein